jgi:hypothetical protein
LRTAASASTRRVSQQVEWKNLVGQEVAALINLANEHTVQKHLDLAIL